jgi:hypothetical protein
MVLYNTVTVATSNSQDAKCDISECMTEYLDAVQKEIERVDKLMQPILDFQSLP